MESSTIEDIRLLATPSQVERALGISRTTLNRLVEVGVIEPVRLAPNANRRFRWTDVARLAKENQDG